MEDIMTIEKKFSVCGMCTVRCPIQVDMKDGDIKFIQGNPHSPLKGALCARGAAGPGLINDPDRIRTPLIREGERGQGKWRQSSWDEALDYVADKLKAVIKEYGSRSVLWSDRGGPFRDLHQAFMKGIGSPNYCNHDATCARNVQHAAMSLFGFGRKGVLYDLKNARHVVLQTRNIFEAINVKEVNDLLDSLGNGGKLTVIDVRANVSAAKANRFLMIKPGTDYALNLAVIHELIDKKLYDADFVQKWFKDFQELENFVRDYTPDWAEGKTGVKAQEIRDFAADLAADSPSVIWHPGWMNARYTDSFYVSRTIYIINSLLGSIGAKGGLPFMAKPGDCGRKGLKAVAGLFPKPEDKRADGAGWKHKHIDPGPGLLHLAFKAIETSDPYPVKAYISYRHDPLMAFPDPEAQKKMLEKLDLLVSVTFSWSATAWHSDVVLPLSPYLERESIIATKNGLKPHFFIRQRALEPKYENRSDWEIICGLAKRLGLDAMAFDSIEDIWKFQLQDTGVSIDDFEATGIVPLTDKPIYFGEDKFQFKTESGKIEMLAPKWENSGIPSLKPYEDKPDPGPGLFRITFGRCGVHTQGHTINNPILYEQMSENVLWINSDKASEMGIAEGDMVRVSANNGYSGKLKAHVTSFIHPQAVFMVHGFGSEVPAETRAFKKGVADFRLMKGGMDIWDKAGGGVALQEHFVKLEKA
jgi:thiosulfate reductase/polysulfide reductase chain A